MTDISSMRWLLCMTLALGVAITGSSQCNDQHLYFNQDDLNQSLNATPACDTLQYLVMLNDNRRCIDNLSEFETVLYIKHLYLRNDCISVEELLSQLGSLVKVDTLTIIGDEPVSIIDSDAVDTLVAVQLSSIADESDLRGIRFVEKSLLVQDCGLDVNLTYSAAERFNMTFRQAFFDSLIMHNWFPQNVDTFSTISINDYGYIRTEGLKDIASIEHLRLSNSLKLNCDYTGLSRGLSIGTLDIEFARETEGVLRFANTFPPIKEVDELRLFWTSATSINQILPSLERVNHRFQLDFNANLIDLGQLATMPLLQPLI